MTPRIAHYPLDETSGSTAYDYSGQENDGTANGAGPSGTGTVSGPLGTSAYDFDGSDDNVEVPDDATLDFGTNPYSFAVWVYRDSSTGRIIDWYDGSNGTTIYYSSTSELTFLQRGSTNTQVQTAISASSGEWVHFAGVRNSANDLKLYENGEVIGTNTGADQNVSSTNPLALGYDVNANSSYLDAKIANVRIYDHALSPPEIQYLYQVSQGGRFVSETKTL